MRVSLRLSILESILLFSRLAYSSFARCPHQDTWRLSMIPQPYSALAGFLQKLKQLVSDNWKCKISINLVFTYIKSLKHFRWAVIALGWIVLSTVMAADDPERITKNNWGSYFFCIPPPLLLLCSSVFLVTMVMSFSRKLSRLAC